MLKMHINISFAYLVKMVGIIFIVNHYVGSFYFNNFSNTNLLENWVNAAGITDSSLSYKYINSMEWSFQTWTTIGYGDLPPN